MVRGQSAIRRKRIDQRYRDDSLADLRLLPIVIDGECDARVWSSALPLADRFDLSVYDACYLELAQRRDLPLATLDVRLRSAGAAMGLWTPPDAGPELAGADRERISRLRSTC